MPVKEFKEMTIKILTGLESKVNEINENIIKEIRDIKRNQLLLWNIITEKKNALERINSRLGDAEE